MKRISLLALLLAFTGAMLTSCKREEVAPDQTAQNIQALQAGVWVVQHVDVNYFDYQGNPNGTERVLFGEGTEGGICTFEYSKDNLWTMDDNGEIFESSYSVEDKVIYTQGGGTWGIREANDTKLEMVLRGEVSNPCDYSQSGAVYTLTRQTPR